MLEFERPLDAEILKQAVVASIGAIPILGARYIEGSKPRWTSLDPVDFERAFVIAPTPAEFEAFLVAKVDEGLGPQIRVCVFNSDRHAVAFKLNHMICDAAGFKQYLGFLATIYSRLTTDANYKPPTIAGDRSLDPILDSFGWGVKLKSLFVQGQESRWTGTHRFPLSDDGGARPFIVAHKLDRAKIRLLKSYCRAQSASVNDALLTAMYRALFRILALKSGDPLQIPIMVDMRRYVDGEPEFESLTNLTAMVSTQLDYRPDESFGETLARTSAVMLGKKSYNIGLNAWVRLKLVYRALGARNANRLLRSRFKESFHLHDQHRDIGCRANVLCRRAPERRLFVRLNKIPALLSACGQHLRWRDHADGQPIWRRGRPETCYSVFGRGWRRVGRCWRSDSRERGCGVNGGGDLSARTGSPDCSRGR